MTTEPLQIAYSPCPNDTFVFDALAHGRVPGAPSLDVTFADIDITNGMAERGEFDVLKVSYAVLPYVLDEYTLLPCGVRWGGVRAAGADAGGRRGSQGPYRRRAVREVDGVSAVPAVGGGRPGGRGREDRRDAVPRDHAGRAGRSRGRGARHSRGALHVSELRAAQARGHGRALGVDDGVADSVGGDHRQARSVPRGWSRSPSPSVRPCGPLGTSPRIPGLMSWNTRRRWIPLSPISTLVCTSTSSPRTSGKTDMRRFGGC